MFSSSEAGKAHSDADIQSSLEPIGDLAAIAGYSVPLHILANETKNNNSTPSKSNRKDLLTLATKVLDNPQMQIRLGNRVFQLLQEDLRHQKERRIG